MAETVLQNWQVPNNNNPIGGRAKGQTYSMHSPLHKRCGTRNANFVGTAGKLSVYRCNTCLESRDFTVREK